MLLPLTGGRLARRFTQLIFGLVLFGSGIGLMLRSGLGMPPWDILHQGLEARFGLTIGIWSVIISILLLLLWIPLKEPFGPGTVLNAVIVGLMIDLTANVVPDAISAWWAWSMLLAGILAIGLASGMYIGARLGPGPRDGLMTGIAKRGPSIRLTRTVIEVVVLGLGWWLGGTFGVGTILFAVAIGPLVQTFLPRWIVAEGEPAVA
jgi:uncharacterized membrane protein YczE